MELPGPEAVTQRWVLAYEGSQQIRPVPTGAPQPIGKPLVIGRQGRLALGVEVRNKGISREALVITATEIGWDVGVPNANGAVLHAWGQSPERLAKRQTIRWPRVAIRVLDPVRADRTATEHWILLEADDLPITRAGPQVSRGTSTSTSRTVTGELPGELSAAQSEAVWTVFGGMLSWPPLLAAEPLVLKQAASRIGISPQAVRDRLDDVLGRAQRLGFSHNVGLTNPEYIYFLVKAGYLRPPAPVPGRVILPWLQ
ncbi:hypothetical protein I6A60_00135 [Frankia sp. AgB1.9]|uniref:hypothetical protein n=1 Tax=unclassified Frankia TaxID=2632575 RepID=UPI001932EC86|nr:MULTISPECIES: hypothetical protein [unclassified Frankia]MBL7487288.1 hypothetical protein [Frankia sp. AgW1.1]MBL7546295.1 hypothetical protein [Frankia sp. AgB1.9]MBL7618660.1 hypothetical protein [Frankia sp. AgB1.8]